VIDQWMAGLFTRLTLLDRNLQRIGLGHARHPIKGWVCVLDISRGREGSQVLIYPPDGLKEVPLAYPGNEIPDPIPEAKVKVAGYPITVTFPPRFTVKDVTAKLKDGRDKEVPIWLSTPEKPAYQPIFQVNTICLLARKPLQAGTAYSVAVSAQVAGQPWRKTWKFTTALRPAGIPAEGKATILKIVNSYRRSMGLIGVALDPELTRHCSLHAEYLVRNMNHPSAKGLGAHQENPKLPGYSPEGHRAGMASVIYHGPYFLESVDNWMNSFFHRIPLLVPDLRRIGFGCARTKEGLWWAVLDARSGKGDNQPSFYPADGQKNVPLAYVRGEQPDPIPESPDKRAGFPITLNFPSGNAVKNVAARLEAGGRVVPVYVSTPEKSVNPILQRNTVGLIAKIPLQPRTTYTVAVTAQVAGKEWIKTWSFTTGPK
jgi:hypothetical protein